MRKTIAELLLCLCLAFFCWWGFAESYEPGADPSNTFKVGYALVGIMSIVVASITVGRAMRR
jgi:hypothetical protein